jgi:hypothetical protein
MYLISRGRTKRNTIVILKGGKMTSQDWTIAMEQVKSLNNGR